MSSSRCVSLFPRNPRGGSRVEQQLTPQSFSQEYLRDKPDTDLSIFPPTREIHIPNECASSLAFCRTVPLPRVDSVTPRHTVVKTFKIFLRDMTEDDGNGQSSAATGTGASGKKQPRQRARKLKQAK